MTWVRISVVSIPLPKTTFCMPLGATTRTLLVSPPTEKLLILAPPVPVVSKTNVVKLVALPPTRTSPIWPVTAPLTARSSREEAAAVPGGAPETTIVPPVPVAAEFWSENWPGGLAASPSISLAWNRSSRPETAKTTPCWIVVGVRSARRAGATCWVLEIDLSMMIRVPP